MNKADINFKKLVRKIIDEGYNTLGEKVRPKYKDGTDSHTYFQTCVFEEYNLEKGEYPILTLRHIPWKSAIKEVLWIYQDQSNDLDLLKEKYNITWWDNWEVNNSRTIGKRYGATVSQYDLLNKLLDGLKNSPYGRRHIMNLYQYSDFLETGGLYPCAMETHWSVRDGKIDMTLIQRSSDVPVANAINKLQYVALMLMVARHCDLKLGKFCHFVQNAHIYDRHIETVEEMCKREGQKNGDKLILELNPEKKDFYSITIDDFEIKGYDPQKPNFKFEIAI